jgi:hypothetical protein
MMGLDPVVVSSGGPNIETGQLGEYDATRYHGMDDAAIGRRLNQFSAILLRRNELASLLVRREIGGLLHEFARQHPRQRTLFEALARTTTGLDYTDARRHIALWVHWHRCVDGLQRLERDAKRLKQQFVVPGLRRLLILAGVVERRGGSTTIDPPAPVVIPPVLPDDLAKLKRIALALMAENRELRGRAVILRNDLAFAMEQNERLHAEIRHLPNLKSRARR